MRSLRHGVALFALLVTTPLVLPAILETSVASAAIPTASALPTGDPTVGATFQNTSLVHGCTASVVTSTTADLILTAAHCLSGTGTNLRFSPGYHDGIEPYGRWVVTAAFVDPSWLATQDPQHDYAILRLARLGGRRIQAVVGSNRLAAAPPAGKTVTVIGYVRGSNDQPITCTVPNYVTTGYPSFDCHGYKGGTSGSPFLRGTAPSRTVGGVVGGLHQGGCVEYTSYSSAFGPDTFTLLARAQAAGPGDTVPPSGPNGC